VHGRSDCLERTVSGEGQVSDAVVDTKRARADRPGAVVQLAAYADQLLAAGSPVADRTVLHLGDGTIATQDTADSVAVYREHRSYVQALLDATTPAAHRWSGVTSGTRPACGATTAGRRWPPPGT